MKPPSLPSHSKKPLPAVGPVGLCVEGSISPSSVRIMGEAQPVPQASSTNPRGIGIAASIVLDEIDPAFLHHLDVNGYREIRAIGDGLYACLVPLLFTCAIVTGRIGDLSGYEDRWCFHSYAVAKAALDAWNGEGEPQGWHRHPQTGRRRPDGDPEQEYINR